MKVLFAIDTHTEELLSASVRRCLINLLISNHQVQLIPSTSLATLLPDDYDWLIIGSAHICLATAEFTGRVTVIGLYIPAAMQKNLPSNYTFFRTFDALDDFITIVRTYPRSTLEPFIS